MPPAGIDWVEPARDTWPLGVRALTTTRGAAGAGRSRGGYARLNLAGHVGDDPGAVAENRRLLAQAHGLGPVQWLRQVHGTRCIEATPGSAATEPEADAAWTRHPGLALAVLTADCVPVVIADRAGSVVGAAHGGWRGLVGGVLGTLVDAMGVPPARLVAWLGPAIGPGAYEVGDEVIDAVAAAPGGESLVAQSVRDASRGERRRLDLFQLSEALLTRVGVETVAAPRLCTYTDGRFYSYRRDGRTGRMATVVWLGR